MSIASGLEQAGWNLLDLHTASKDRVALGHWEYIRADGPTPYVLSGRRVIAGDEPDLGKFTKGKDIITADEYRQAWSLITRKDEK